MKKNWIVATYKLNQVERLENNLKNQKFDYYLPKITIKKFNAQPKVEVLFPGYIFVNTSIKNYSALKYTVGIKNILKFGHNVSYISNEEIKAMQIAESSSKIEPLTSQIQIGQDALIAMGPLKGSIVKICSLPCNERVGILLTFLGSIRRITISKKDIVF